MSDTFSKIVALIDSHEVRISEHGYNELADDNLTVQEVLNGVKEALVIEDYPEFPKGPSVLLLQWDVVGGPIHVVWGIPRGHQTPAVLVTAYRPDLNKWSEDFKERRK